MWEYLNKEGCVNMRTNEKKKSGCLSKFFKFFLIIIAIGVLLNLVNDTPIDSSKNTTVQQITTKAPTITATPYKTAAPTAMKTAAPTKEPKLEITLTYPTLGEYGRYYTFNEKVSKATAEDKETIIQCFIPAGNYTLTNEGKYPTFVFIYSEKTVISSSGWEEPAETWVSGMLQVGDSCEITIKENQYINLQENDVFKLIEK